MRAATSTGWLPRSDRGSSTTIDVYCLPYAGGGASAFRGWDAVLGPEIAVRPVQLPGHESRMREPLETRLTGLVSALLPAIVTDVHVPYVVFGHSMGALIAFELTRALRAIAKPMPSLLVVSAYRAPHLPDLDEPVHELDDPSLLAHLERMAGTPPAVLQDEALCALILPIVRADFEVCETYTFVPEQPLDVPIVVYHGADDDRMSADDAKAWSEHTTATCTFRSFPGDHFFVHSARSDVLDDLRIRCLLSASAATR